MANILISLAVALPMAISGWLVNPRIASPARLQCVPPVAEPDAYSVRQDEILQVDAPGVLENDQVTEPDKTMKAELVNAASHGVVTLGKYGSFTYAPEPGYSGEDQFTYKAYYYYNEKRYYSNEVTVTITVIPPERVYLP